MKTLNTKAFRERVLHQFKDKKVPVMGTFEITGRCNFDCKMCYVHTKSNIANDITSCTEDEINCDNDLGL